MWIADPKEEQLKLVNMDWKEFDQYMCKEYPTLFQNRNGSMQETCMCWGFEIPNGWYWILDDLCKQLVEIEKGFKVSIVFDQIKEKFGGARFYNHINFTGCEGNFGVISSIVENLVSYAEDKCEYFCCGSGMSLSGLKDEDIKVVSYCRYLKSWYEKNSSIC